MLPFFVQGAENDEEVTIEYRGVHFAPVVVRSKDPCRIFIYMYSRTVLIIIN